MTASKNPVWESRATELSEMAKTMTSSQIGSVYGVTRRSMTDILRRLGIKAYNPQDVWRDREQELRELAKTKTPAQLAKHYGITADTMRETMRKFAIPYIKPAVRETNPYLELITELGKTMTVPQIAAHTGKAANTLYDYIKRHKIKVQSTELNTKDFWKAQESKLAELSKTKYAYEIAKEYDVSASRMRAVLCTLGIPCFKPEKQAPKEKKPKAPKLQPIAMNREIPLVKKKAAPVKTTVEKIVIMPESVKVKVYERPKSSDPRCVMAAPVWNPSKRNFLGNYV